MFVFVKEVHVSLVFFQNIFDFCIIFAKYEYIGVCVAEILLWYMFVLWLSIVFCY